METQAQQHLDQAYNYENQGKLEEASLALVSEASSSGVEELRFWSVISVI